ncbi:MAG TPA: hypothetical protein PLZ57_03460 [Pseudobdellovibrionaceae bacterium]|nr:hypothetical protein [Pseudobdellovibrionaceae bacterium]
MLIQLKVRDAAMTQAKVTGSQTPRSIRAISAVAIAATTFLGVPAQASTRTFTEGNWKAATMTVEMSRDEFLRWWKIEVSESKPPRSAVQFDELRGSCVLGPKAQPELQRRDSFDYRLRVFTEPVGAQAVRVRAEMWIYRFRTRPPQSEQEWRTLQHSCLAPLMQRSFEDFEIKGRTAP